MIGGVLSPDVVLPKRKARANMEKVNQMANGKRICLDSAKRSMNLFLKVTLRFHCFFFQVLFIYYQTENITIYYSLRKSLQKLEPGGGETSGLKFSSCFPCG